MDVYIFIVFTTRFKYITFFFLARFDSFLIFLNLLLKLFKIITNNYYNHEY